ncbi:hypothetical protein [Dyella sp.]|uniref:hypothetical protein n=1 Tax=Dyella sp. TaxID=1869338 RepID=UPI00284B2A52|nr:hypothetical protein [Dyella sp.]MDR3445400.1 hypothetical protein [Dyella sp.]
MARFTVRVELHDADEDDYELLHKRMGAANFNKYITTRGGKDLGLPTAEYRYFSDTESNEQVVDKAYDIAKRVKSEPSVISTEGSIEHRGLEEI